MPGFNIGGGAAAAQPSAIAESRRTHRWVWQVLGIMRKGEAVFLKKAQRPNFKYEPAEMHHNQEVAWFAGKQSWEPIALEWYDVENPDISKRVFDWVQKTTFNFPNAAVNPPSEYKLKSDLLMLDGAGATTETWSIFNSWPVETNWNELDYTSSEIQLIAVTLRYDRAIRG